ncbi:hypothetical protein CVS28_14625 [Arthrobacter glacialis]|uniref:Uncharacterized protein n=2 Tax=Arthrobacter glacialis TaxID=1664 RepID=A0A2S3ZRR6_ARTGL|nr:hypothetical protein CVS28_14625 [Arthrobacter glacialis]POH71692.1 hypothetical protein CVS27_19705 [Arthrobacter glacialis]
MRIRNGTNTMSTNIHVDRPMVAGTRIDTAYTAAETMQKTFVRGHIGSRFTGLLTTFFGEERRC